MSNSSLMIRARTLVERIQRQLPPEIKPLALEVPVSILELPNPDTLEEDLDEDILGLFVGEAHGSSPGMGNSVPPQIFLFVANILDEAGGDLLQFDEEVRITYLHELGHYLGWDEDDVEARGL